MPMITGLDIRQTVVNMLNITFEKIPVLTPETLEDYDLGVFFVYLENLSWQSINNGYNKHTYSVEIQYEKTRGSEPFFEGGENSVDLMMMAELLSALFADTIQIKDRYVLVGSGKASLYESSLYYVFDVNFTERKPHIDDVEGLPIARKLGVRLAADEKEIPLLREREEENG